MAMRRAFFPFFNLLAPNFAIFCERLRDVGVTKPLRIAHLSAAIAVAHYEGFDAPLRIRRRTLAATTEELLVLDLQGPNVLFELNEVFFGRSGHRFALNMNEGRCS